MASSRKPKIQTFAVKDHPFYSGVATQKTGATEKYLSANDYPHMI